MDSTSWTEFRYPWKRYHKGREQGRERVLHLGDRLLGSDAKRHRDKKAGRHSASGADGRGGYRSHKKTPVGFGHPYPLVGRLSVWRFAQLREPRPIAESVPQRGMPEIGVTRVDDVRLAAARPQQQRSIGLHTVDDPSLLHEVVVQFAVGRGLDVLRTTPRMRRVLSPSKNDKVTWLE